MRTITKMGFSALRANITGRAFPLNVILSVTNRCMGNCAYCRIPMRGGDELTLAQIKDLIDQISGLGCQRLGIWGGEPLLRDDIGEIIHYAKKRNLFVTLDSNGYLLSQRKEIFKELDHLILAFDGDEKSHDANRGAGSFQKAMAAIDLASGKIPLWTITVLTKNNLHSINFLFEAAKKYGFMTTFQVLHHNDVLGADYNSLRPPDRDCREAIEKIIAEKKKGAPVASSFNYLDHLRWWPDFSVSCSDRPLQKARCWAGKLYCNIDADGSVYPCSLLIGKMKSMKFFEAGFQRVFESMGTDLCKSCVAACYTEYNYLYSLNMKTIVEWCTAMAKS